MDALDNPILDDECVSLRPVVAEDAGGVKVELERLGELARGIGEVADLDAREHVMTLSSSSTL